MVVMPNVLDPEVARIKQRLAKYSEPYIMAQEIINFCRKTNVEPEKAISWLISKKS